MKFLTKFILIILLLATYQDNLNCMFARSVIKNIKNFQPYFARQGIIAANRFAISTKVLSRNLSTKKGIIQNFMTKLTSSNNDNRKELNNNSMLNYIEPIIDEKGRKLSQEYYEKMAELYLKKIGFEKESDPQIVEYLVNRIQNAEILMVIILNNYIKNSDPRVAELLNDEFTQINHKKIIELMNLYPKNSLIKAMFYFTQVVEHNSDYTIKDILKLQSDQLLGLNEHLKKIGIINLQESWNFAQAILSTLMKDTHSK